VVRFSRFELLFLLFSECNDPDSTGHNSIENYLKDAQEGVVAAQFIVGLAHLEGYGVEKDERSAYYWLRMAEENSSTIRSRSHASSMNSEAESQQMKLRL